MNQPVAGGQFQNVQRPQDDANLTRKKHAVRVLARMEMFFTIACTVSGVIELNVFSGCGYYYNCYNTIGQGVWCSILPYVAAILGMKASRSSASRTQITLLTVFSILGAMSMATMMIIETLYLYMYYQSLTAAMAAISLFNMILFIISSSYSCSMGCCHQENSTSIYVGSPPGSGQPVYRIPADGMYVDPQMLAANLPPYQPQYGENIVYPAHMTSQPPQMTSPPSYQASTNPAYLTNESYQANEGDPPKYQPNAEC